ncbi:leucine-rich repeat serine/threonine-protein kinase 2-like [Rhopilema esculentum]|uniref:leucine-rich repeat serine/threonine-protein kinase 2-like n=1 Tax=Rhopilema esculentum TaxID=499914 RepID=UPI0031D189B0
MNSLEWIMTHYGDRRVRFFNSMFQEPSLKQTAVFFLLHIAVLRNDRQVPHMILSQDDAADTHGQWQHAKIVLQTYFSKSQMEFFTKEMLDSLRQNAKSIDDRFKRSLTRFAIKRRAFNLVKDFLHYFFNDKEEQSAVWSQLLLVEAYSGWFLEIKSFQNLSLAENKLQYVPTVLLKMQRLTRLDLSFNKICEIPHEIFNMPSLRWLDLTDNEIRAFPPVSSWSKFFIYLNLSGNKLTTIDDSIADSNLQELNLARNRLAYVPDCIWNIGSLKSLWLSGNSYIEALPPDLAKLKNLGYLEIKDMVKLTDPPKSKRGSTKEIISYLMGKLRDTKPFYTMKLMILGKNGVGKTTLMHRLDNDYTFKQNNATESINIQRIDINKYAFNCWDVAGHNDCCAISNCFLTQRTLYLAVWNVKEENKGIDSLKPWLDNLQCWAPHSHVIIIGTHLDKIAGRRRDLGFDDTMNSRVWDLVSKYERLKCVMVLMLTNSVLAEDVKECKARIKRLQTLIFENASEVTLGESQYGPIAMDELIPKSYLSVPKLVKEKVTELEREAKLPLLSKAEFENMLKDNSKKYPQDYSDPDDLMKITKLLHEIGIVLHYEDPCSNLGDMYFINPSWLCQLIVRMISDKCENSHGILHCKDLECLLSNNSLYVNLTRLIHRFQVACSISEHRFLIFSKLPQQNPVGFFGLQEPGRTITRIHSFPRISHGFWTRLISRFTACFNEIFSLLSNRKDEETKDSWLDIEQAPFKGDVKVETTKQKDEQLQKENIDIFALIGKKKLIFWRQGILLNHPDLFLSVVVRRGENARELVETKVSHSSIGFQAFSLMLEHIYSVVTEWNRDMSVREMSQLAPCPICLDYGMKPPHLFDVYECLSVEDHLVCKNHDSPRNIKLCHIFPELPLNDLSYNINTITVEENLLGFGTFAKVYSGKQGCRSVAIKVYKTVKDIPSLALEVLYEMRREACMLTRCRECPFVIPFYGGLRYPNCMLVTELANKGSLRMVLKAPQLQIPRIVVYRMAQQIICALAYLHSLGIIHRDLKSDNVLVFSLESDIRVNVKLADFGSANLVSPVGLKLRKGTSGFIAPEVLCGMHEYDAKVDVFSFAMVLYEMITKRRPFYLAQDNFERDDEVKAGKRPTINDVIATQFSLLTLTELMTKAWAQVATNRPTSQEIKLQLKSPGFCLLYGKIPLRGIASFCYLYFIQCSKDVWISCQDSKGAALIVIDPLTSSIKKRFCSEGSSISKYLKNANMVVSIHAVNDDYIAMHTRCKFDSILIYSLKEERNVSWHQLEYRWISSMKMCHNHVFIGFKDGNVLKMGKAEFLTGELKGKDLVTVNKEFAVTAINTSISEDNLFIGCGKYLYVYSVSALEHFKHIREPNDETISQIGVSLCDNLLTVSYYNSPTISIFSTNTIEYIGEISTWQQIGRLLPTIDLYGQSITCFCIVDDTLWAGTGSGYILIYSIESSGQHCFMTAIRPYKMEVRSIISFPNTGGNPARLVVTTGRKVNLTAFCDKDQGLCLLTGALPADKPESSFKRKESQTERPLDMGKIWPNDIKRCQDRHNVLKDAEDHNQEIRNSKARHHAAQKFNQFEDNLLLIWEALPAHVLKRILEI